MVVSWQLFLSCLISARLFCLLRHSNTANTWYLSFFIERARALISFIWKQNKPILNFWKRNKGKDMHFRQVFSLFWQFHQLALFKAQHDISDLQVLMIRHIIFTEILVRMLNSCTSMRDLLIFYFSLLSRWLLFSVATSAKTCRLLLWGQETSVLYQCLFVHTSHLCQYRPQHRGKTRHQ